MVGRRLITWSVMAACALAGGALARAGQGVGQTPSPLPLSQTIREHGSSVTGAFEGWFYAKDGSTYALLGYFNRNTKQEFDIPAGQNNRIEPGTPDQGQPTHFLTGRQWGVFTIKVPKDMAGKKLMWTLVANGFTNAITIHTQADYIVEPYEDPANKNTPPVVKFEADGKTFTGPPIGIAATYAGTVGVPLTLTTWVTDEGPKINIPEPTSRGRGRATGDAAARGRSNIPPEFQPPPPLAVTWSKFRGPGDVKFDNAKPEIDKGDGKSTAAATFSAPGDYILRFEANDSTGPGGGGFQCCWTNAHVAVSVKAAASAGR
jgi:hypothetical protein